MVTPERPRRADRAQGQDPLSGLRADLRAAGRATSRSICRRARRRPAATRRWSTASPRWCRKSGERLGWSVEQVAVDQQSRARRRLPRARRSASTRRMWSSKARRSSISVRPRSSCRRIARARGCTCRWSGSARAAGAGGQRPHLDPVRRRSRHGDDGAAGPRCWRPRRVSSSARSCRSWLVALLGGLILNVMPCVLPVLLLKLTGVLDLAGPRARSHLRGAFLSTAAGIVASFLVLAGGLVALKPAGASVGWGIQFQQPAFLAADGDGLPAVRGERLGPVPDSDAGLRRPRAAWRATRGSATSMPSRSSPACWRPRWRRRAPRRSSAPRSASPCRAARRRSWRSSWRSVLASRCLISRSRRRPQLVRLPAAARPLDALAEGACWA